MGVGREGGALTGEIVREAMSGSADEPETDALNDGTKEKNASYRPESIDVGAGRVDNTGDGIDASVDIAASDATLDVRERDGDILDSVVV